MSTVIIYCGECGTKIVTDTKHAGRAAVCSECKAKVPIPRKAIDKPQFRLFCPGCESRVSAELSKGGQAMQCPKCKREIELPRIKVGRISQPTPSKDDMERGEWMPRGMKKPVEKKTPRKGDTEPVIVPPPRMPEKGKQREQEDEILQLLRSLDGIEKRRETDAIDAVEVLDDDDNGTRRAEVPTVIDEEFQRAETQKVEPVHARLKGGKGPLKEPSGKEARDTFRFTCPKCGFRMLVNQAAVGSKGRCPDCKEIVVVRKP